MAVRRSRFGHMRPENRTQAYSVGATNNDPYKQNRLHFDQSYVSERGIPYKNYKDLLKNKLFYPIFVRQSFVVLNFQLAIECCMQLYHGPVDAVKFA